ncbi:MAG: zinc ABC transporter substrate-binding protein [Candidatus Microgenomates bacterium]|jgi:zinc transport system substrate-binding protein
MKNKIIIFTTLAILVLGGTWAIFRNQAHKSDNNKLEVTASFYSYYFFASQVGGNKVSVINITPPGGEPHDYEPTPQDIINIESSKLLILNGNVEPWANKIKDLLKGKNTVILETGSGLFTQTVVDENGINSTDPHIWLSPKLAKTQVNSILDKYIQIDPQNKDYYTNNANNLLNDLNSLDMEYKTGLASCRLQDIITSHAAFGYLAADYGLKQIAIAGLSPDSEPSLKQLAEIASFAKTNNIKYIFFESLVSPKLSQTIASEVGAKTLVLNPIEGLTSTEISQGKNYLTVMQDNLKNLRLALDCK